MSKSAEGRNDAIQALADRRDPERQWGRCPACGESMDLFDGGRRPDGQPYFYGCGCPDTPRPALVEPLRPLIGNWRARGQATARNGRADTPRAPNGRYASPAALAAAAALSHYKRLHFHASPADRSGGDAGRRRLRGGIGD